MATNAAVIPKITQYTSTSVRRVLRIVGPQFDMRGPLADDLLHERHSRPGPRREIAVATFRALSALHVLTFPWGWCQRNEAASAGCSQGCVMVVW